MTPHRKRHDEWHRTESGMWICKLGRRGELQVKLFEKRSNRYYYADVRAPGHHRKRTTLGTNDRAEADRLGRKLYLDLLSGRTEQHSTVPDAIRLGKLCERYLDECPLHLDNTMHGQKEARTRLQILRCAIGDTRDVRTLTINDVRQYEARRKQGGIRYRDAKARVRVTGVVRQRSVQADVKLLKQVLYWACTVTEPNGQPWLERNSLADVEVRSEPDVRRPVATQERFEATMTAMRKRQEKYAAEVQTTTKRERDRAESRLHSWIRAELGLVLLEATGRRRGAIMGLRWDDVDFDTHRITWCAEKDKKRRTSVVPYASALFDALRDVQRKLGAIGGPIFPRTKDRTRSAPAELLSQWIAMAEDDAKLSKLKGGTCHPYRRKWRSERMHHPIKAVAVAGGWSDFDTMLRCYDIPDEADVLAVTSESRKRREVVPGTASTAHT